MDRIEYIFESLIILGRLFVVPEIREVLHVEMFIITSPNDFMRPDEEHSGDDIRIFFERRLISELLVDLKLFLVRLLIHESYQSENYK